MTWIDSQLVLKLQPVIHALVNLNPLMLKIISRNVVWINETFDDNIEIYIF